MSARILIIEDNEDLALGLRRSLEVEGYSVDVAHDGEEGIDRARNGRPDLVVLDLMLPRVDGFDVLDALRGDGNDVPVLILSARGEDVDKVRGFRLGADNYAVKPIGVLELLARVEAMLRRARPVPDPPATLEFGNVRIDVASRSVFRHGARIELSPREFDLLLHLLGKNGAVVQRDQLLQEVWGYKRPVPTRTVDAHVASLRAKLEDDPATPLRASHQPRIFGA